MLRFSRGGEVGVTEETTAFADAMIFDGSSAELRDGCVRVAAGTIAEVAEGTGGGAPGDPRPPELGCCLGGGHMAEVVDGVEVLRRAARGRLRGGAHAIKIMASGGVISPSDPLRALDGEQLHGLRLQAEVEGPLAL